MLGQRNLKPVPASCQFGRLTTHSPDIPQKHAVNLRTRCKCGADNLLAKHDRKVIVTIGAKYLTGKFRSGTFHSGSSLLSVWYLLSVIRGKFWLDKFADLRVWAFLLRISHRLCVIWLVSHGGNLRQNSEIFNQKLNHQEVFDQPTHVCRIYSSIIRILTVRLVSHTCLQSALKTAELLNEVHKRTELATIFRFRRIHHNLNIYGSSRIVWTLPWVLIRMNYTVFPTEFYQVFDNLTARIG